MCAECGQSASDCACRKRSGIPDSDGVVRVRREIKGRKGKTVTTISGVPLDENGVKALAGQLKQRLGTGGSVKDGVIIIQGDHRNKLMDLLKSDRFRVKLAGG